MSEALVSALSDLVSELTVDASEQQIIDRAVVCAVDLLPINGAGITMIDEHPDRALVAATDAKALSLERLQARMQQGPCLVAHADIEACLSPDVATDPRFDRYGPAAVSVGASGVFAFPLRHDGRSLGTIDLYRTTAGGLTGGEVAVAQVLCDAIAAFLVNARARLTQELLVAQLRAAANHDALTGLPDRVLLVDRLGQALRRRGRSQTEVAVAFIDLDGFKAVNDRYGHHVGDLLLVALSGRLSATLRPADTLVRWGGDEFVLVIEGLTDRGELDELLARLDEQLAEAFEINGLTISISGSCGGALSDGATDTPQSVIEAADRAMYAHKRERRGPRVDGPDGPSRADGSEVVGDLSVSASGWQERWIDGPTVNGGIVTYVIAHEGRDELLLTELDDRALVVMRHEWLPVPADRSGAAGFELTVSDWDGREVARRIVTAMPDAPRDQVQLARLLGGSDGG